MSVFGQTLKGRFAALGIIILLVLGSLLVRLWSMQIISGEVFAKQAENNHIRNVTIAAPRGRIFDRNGRPLVVNRPTLAVVAEPSVLTSDTLLGRLSAVTNLRVSEIERRIVATKMEALQPRVLMLDTPQPIVSYLSEHSGDFPGVEVQTVPVRVYPYAGLGAHVLGYVGEISEEQMNDQNLQNYSLADIVGKAGVERELETVLQGDKGFQRKEVDAKGRVRAVLDRREPIPGRDVKLTIDIEVQKVAEQALQNALKEAHKQKYPKARAGAAVVLDVKTGEVIAMASAPTYDPRRFLNGISQAEWKSLSATASEFPLNNRAVMAAYPPASTFKVVTGLAGLQQGFTSASQEYDCKGTWTFPGHEDSNALWWKKKCWKTDGHHAISFTNGIEESCDTVFYTIGYQFYETPGEKLQAFARAAGFGAETGVDVPGEVAGRVPDAAWKARYNEFFPEYRAWLPGDTVNMAIGQGDLLVTPLQLTQLFAGVGNGGKEMKPHVLQQVLGSSGKGAALTPKPQVAHKLPVSAENLSIMHEALVGVTEDGTARETFGHFPVKVAGKTGTAQVKGKDDYAWFGAYAPADSPRYAVVVVIEQGGHGGSVAAPAGREILSKLLDVPIVHVSASDASR